MPDPKRKKSRINVDEENVLNGCHVWTEMGKQAIRNNKFRTAMRHLDAALELKPNDIRPMKPRADALNKLGLYDKAIEELKQLEAASETAGRQLPLDALVLKIRALWKSGRFEEAAVMAARANRIRERPPYFRDLLYSSLGTMEHVIGPPAGECMVELSNTIHAMIKQRKRAENERKKQHFETPPTREEMCKAKRREELQKRWLVSKAHMYLEQLSQDWEFVHTMQNNMGLTSANKAGVGRVNLLLTNLRQDLARRLDHLEEQSPMYVRDICRRARESPQLMTRRQKFEEKRRASTMELAVSALLKIMEARDTGDTKVMLDRCLLAREMFMALPKKIFPQKYQCLTLIYHLLGMVYLEMLLLPTEVQVEGQPPLQESQLKKIREGHIKAILMMNPKKSDLVLAHSSMPFNDYRSKLRRAEKDLRLAQSPVERVWLLHDMAMAHCRMANYERCRIFCRKALAEARAINAKVWGINAAVLMAVAELHLNSHLDAKTSIKEALELGTELQDEYVIEMLQAILKELDKLKASSNVYSIEDQVEKKLVRLMPNAELRVQYQLVLEHIAAMPTESRLHLTKGPSQMALPTSLATAPRSRRGSLFAYI